MFDLRVVSSRYQVPPSTADRGTTAVAPPPVGPSRPGGDTWEVSDLDSRQFLRAIVVRDPRLASKLLTTSTEVMIERQFPGVVQTLRDYDARLVSAEDAQKKLNGLLGKYPDPMRAQFTLALHEFATQEIARTPLPPDAARLANDFASAYRPRWYDVFGFTNREQRARDVLAPLHPAAFFKLVSQLAYDEGLRPFFFSDEGIKLIRAKADGFADQLFDRLLAGIPNVDRDDLTPSDFATRDGLSVYLSETWLETLRAFAH